MSNSDKLQRILDLSPIIESLFRRSVGIVGEIDRVILFDAIDRNDHINVDKICGCDHAERLSLLANKVAKLRNDFDAAISEWNICESKIANVAPKHYDAMNYVSLVVTLIEACGIESPQSIEASLLSQYSSDLKAIPLQDDLAKNILAERDKLEQSIGNPQQDGGDFLLSAGQLAARFSMSEDAVRGRLKRWRAKHIDGFTEVENPKPREPRFLYSLNAVESMLAKRK